MTFNIKENIRPVSDFRKETAQMIKKLKETHLPIILTQRGRSVAVILDVDAYEKLEYEHRFRSSYAQGAKELEEGKAIPHGEAMRDLDRKLKSISSR